MLVTASDVDEKAALELAEIDAVGRAFAVHAAIRLDASILRRSANSEDFRSQIAAAALCSTG